VPANLSLLLSDQLLNLDEEILVSVNGKSVFSSKASRSAGAIRQCLSERFDDPASATAILSLP